MIFHKCKQHELADPHPIICMEQNGDTEINSRPEGSDDNDRWQDIAFNFCPFCGDPLGENERPPIAGMKVWIVSTQHRGAYCLCATEELAEKEIAKIKKATDDPCWISEKADISEEDLLQLIRDVGVKKPHRP